MELIFGLKDIDAVAKKFISATANFKVFALHGEMGAGKTTFVHAICNAMQVTDTVSSPTFSIIHQYKTAEGEAIYHLDLYRIKSESEAIDAGVEDCLYSGNICFVEWPDKAPGIFPDDTLHLSISIIDNMRKIIW